MHWNEEVQVGYFTIPSVKEIIMWIILIIGFIAFYTALIENTTAKAETPISGFSKIMDDYYRAGGGQYTEEEITLLSEVMQLENGDASDTVLLLTGSVVLNRIEHPWFPDTMEGVIYQGYHAKGPQQYATETIERLGKVTVTKRVRQLASFLLTFGSIAPKNVIYQAMFRQGSGVYYEERGEIFCYE